MKKPVDLPLLVVPGVISALVSFAIGLYTVWAIAATSKGPMLQNLVGPFYVLVCGFLLLCVQLPIGFILAIAIDRCEQRLPPKHRCGIWLLWFLGFPCSLFAIGFAIVVGRACA